MEEFLKGLKTFDPGVPDPSEIISVGTAPVCAKMKRTKEWRKNIAISNTGKSHMKGKCSKVWKITYENGNTEIVYEGLPLWCEKNGYSWSKIRDLSRGKAKKSSGLVSVMEVSQGRWQRAKDTL